MKNAVPSVAVVALSVALFADLCGAEGLSIGLNFVVARETTDNASGPRVSERAGATDLSDLRARTFHAWLISSGSSNPWTGNLTGTLPASELITPGVNDPDTDADGTGAGGLVVSREGPLGAKSENASTAQGIDGPSPPANTVRIIVKDD